MTKKTFWLLAFGLVLATLVSCKQEADVLDVRNVPDRVDHAYAYDVTGDYSGTAMVSWTDDTSESTNIKSYQIDIMLTSGSASNISLSLSKVGNRFYDDSGNTVQLDGDIGGGSFSVRNYPVTTQYLSGYDGYGSPIYSSRVTFSNFSFTKL